MTTLSPRVAWQPFFSLTSLLSLWGSDCAMVWRMVSETDVIQPPVALELPRTREVFFPGRLFKLCNRWYVFVIFDGEYFQELHTLINAERHYQRVTLTQTWNELPPTGIYLFIGPPVGDKLRNSAVPRSEAE